jgi:hydroxycarboxylate dehydrogenase B
VTTSEPVALDRGRTEDWGRRVLIALGATASAARTTVEHLLEAEDSGHPSHGVRMLVSIADAAERGDLDPAARPALDCAGGIARIDGRRGLGPPIGHLAAARAVDLARRNGTSAVAVRESGTLGRLAPYAAWAAASGCALLVFASDGGANQSVVPHGGIDGRLSTNPIAFGFPRPTPPHLVLDMATSACALGTLAALREAGEPLPEHALLDADRELLLPMAGHKGFGLGLLVEALAGALTGAGVVQHEPPTETQGALFVAIDVNALRPLASAAQDLEDAITWVRSARLAGAEAIRIPGEHRGAATDPVAVPAGVWTRMMRLGAKLGVAVPDPT